MAESPIPRSKAVRLRSAWTLLTAGVFAGVSVVVAYETLLRREPIAIPDREITQQELQDLLALARQPLWTIEGAEEVAKRFGSGAIPYLRAEVQNTAREPAMRGVSAFFLGAYRDAAAAPYIVDFVEGQTAGEFDSRSKMGVAMAMDGLGLTGSPDALDFLERVAQDDYWGDIEIGDSARRLVQRRAIHGLGEAYDGRGMSRLRHLRELVNPQFSQDIDAALARARKRKWGMDRF